MKTAVYHVRVEVSQPLRAADDDSDDYPTEAYAVSHDAKRQLEIAVLACLRRLEPECTDCEVMDVSVEDDA